MGLRSLPGHAGLPGAYRYRCSCFPDAYLCRCACSPGTNRGIKDVSASHVWAFLGDGEMDEPESTAAL
ncbi:hypothetical protein ACWDE9_36610, partial [Streptomyces olivaceoviridis]